ERLDNTEQFITKDLLKHPNIKPLKTISLSAQREGNCVWLSEKMGMYACFIARFLKEGKTLEESQKLAKTLFKEWSELDRINLLKAYLDHPYHNRPGVDNEKEGILFNQTIE